MPYFTVDVDKIWPTGGRATSERRLLLSFHNDDNKTLSSAVSTSGMEQATRLSVD